jgi:chemotaxis receptor (MCP) glutamine deamidase CheD
MGYSDNFQAVGYGTVEDVKYFVEEKEVNVNSKDKGGKNGRII